MEGEIRPLVHVWCTIRGVRLIEFLSRGHCIYRSIVFLGIRADSIYHAYLRGFDRISGFGSMEFDEISPASRRRGSPSCTPCWIRVI